MVGVLLRSGSVKHVLPLGATGNPVYRAASQLRAAMRRQLGPGQDLADFFAIPKQDDKGETIDWYSPFEGNVVPWTAATPEERAEAKSKLLAAQRQLQQMSETFSAAEDSERQVFGRLLALATRIPGEDHVYLVNGRPVMTFWGFSERDATTDRDVLSGLDTGPGYPQETTLADTVAEGAAMTAARSRWWSWPWLLLPLLLLLLLLALLLFGFRRCAPEWLPQIELIPPVHKEEPALPEEKKPPEEGRKPEDRSDQSERQDVDQGSLEKRGSEDRTVVDDLDRDGVVRRSGTRTGEFDSTYEGSRSTDETVDSDRQDTEAAEAADRTGTNADESAEDDKADVEESTDTAATDEKATASGEDEEKAGEKGDQDEADRGQRDDASAADQQKNRGREKTAGDTDVRTKSDAAGKTRDTGAPLVIPRDAAKKGSTDFMNGNWRSVTGLQDAAGNPVQLEYEFKGGQGTAKLRRTVGGKEQECTAAVQPSFKGSRLVIDQAEDIRCPDGSTFQRSSVECTTNPQGRAECKGKNVDGSDYQVRINKK